MTNSDSVVHGRRCRMRCRWWCCCCRCCCCCCRWMGGLIDGAAQFKLGNCYCTGCVIWYWVYTNIAWDIDTVCDYIICDGEGWGGNVKVRRNGRDETLCRVKRGQRPILQCNALLTWLCLRSTLAMKVMGHGKKQIELRNKSRFNFWTWVPPPNRLNLFFSQIVERAAVRTCQLGHCWNAVLSCGVCFPVCSDVFSLVVIVQVAVNEWRPIWTTSHRQYASTPLVNKPHLRLIFYTMYLWEEQR